VIYVLGSLFLLGLAQPIATELASGRPDASGNSYHRVLATCWASGDAANHGRNPYEVQPLTFRIRVPARDARIVDLNLNPPLLLPLFQALELVPIETAAYVLTYLSWLLFVLSGGILLTLHPAMQKRQALWLLLSMPVISTLGLGQIYSLLLLLGIGIWASLRRGNITLAALCLGWLIAIRPLFLVWPVLLLFRRDRRLAWYSLTIAAALTLLPLIIYGPGMYLQWFHALGHDPHFIFLTDIALPAVGQRFGFPYVGWAMAVITGAVCIFAAARRHTPVHMLSILCACLCAPLAWTHYLLVAYPWIVQRRWNWLRGAAAVLLLVPNACFFFMMSTPRRAALGTVLAMAIPLLLLADAWLDPMQRDGLPCG
jgi:hypothetical protein